MTTVAIVYHSGFGHTEMLAKAIHRGASLPGVAVHSFKVSPTGTLPDEAWPILEAATGIIFGCPTYMGSGSAPLKAFMDSTSKLWFERKWVNKLAGGFTNSHGFSGDKLSTLIQLALFAAQHGMIWVNNNLLSAGQTPNDINRLTSFLGIMAQSDNASPDVTPPKGDLATGEQYGAHIATLALKVGKALT